MGRARPTGRAATRKSVRPVHGRDATTRRAASWPGISARTHTGKRSPHCGGPAVAAGQKRSSGLIGRAGSTRQRVSHRRDRWLVSVRLGAGHDRERTSRDHSASTPFKGNGLHTYLGGLRGHDGRARRCAGADDSSDGPDAAGVDSPRPAGQSGSVHGAGHRVRHSLVPRPGHPCGRSTANSPTSCWPSLRRTRAAARRPAAGLGGCDGLPGGCGRRARRRTGGRAHLVQHSNDRPRALWCVTGLGCDPEWHEHPLLGQLA